MFFHFLYIMVSELNFNMSLLSFFRWLWFIIVIHIFGILRIVLVPIYTDVLEDF